MPTVAEIAARPSYRLSSVAASKALSAFALAKQAVREGFPKFAPSSLGTALRSAASARRLLVLENRYDRGAD